MEGVGSLGVCPRRDTGAGLLPSLLASVPACSHHDVALIRGPARGPGGHREASTAVSQNQPSLLPVTWQASCHGEGRLPPRAPPLPRATESGRRGLPQPGPPPASHQTRGSWAPSGAGRPQAWLVSTSCSRLWRPGSRNSVGSCHWDRLPSGLPSRLPPRRPEAGGSLRRHWEQENEVRTGHCSEKRWQLRLGDPLSLLCGWEPERPLQSLLKPGLARELRTATPGPAPLESG